MRNLFGANDQIEIRDLRKSAWIWAHKDILFSPYVTASDFKVYCCLCAFSGNETQKTWVSIERICDSISMSRATAVRSLQKLENIGVVEVRRKVGRSNTYFLLDFDEIKAPKNTKKTSEHHQLIKFFYDNVKRARGFTPKFDKKDFSMLKRLIAESNLSSDDIEKMMVFFLYDPSYAKFTPSIATLFSSGILNAILNKMANEEGFWRKMDNYLISAQKSHSAQNGAELRVKIADLVGKMAINSR